MAFCTYVYRDPKTSTPRYVGKGLPTRPYEHLSCGKRAHQRLRRMIAKRKLEGYNPQPIVINAESESDAFEMEELLIAMIGRLDLGTGTLFNNTNGGEGETGRIVPEHVRRKTSETFHSRSAEDKQKTFKLLSEHKKAMWASKTPEQRAEHIEKTARTKRRRCTVDGVQFFNSRKELIEALGQGSSGSRSPNFQYV